ncbi:uncharacterized protein [Panulirus ornatus]
MGSSTWLVGETKVTVSVGPLRPPVTGTVGVWVGLWHVNLTYVTANLSLNERVTWDSRMDLVRAHRTALEDGWPWALLGITAELGGEGSGWRGCLSDGIRQAGLVSSCFLVASSYVWAVWVVLFTVAPELTARPLMVTGLLMALSALAYVILLGIHVPPQFVLCGSPMHLHLGIAWWLTTVTGVVLTVAGAGLLLYNTMRPGHLSTFFEIDFGLVSHRSFHPTWNREPLFAYKHGETYSQYSPFVLCAGSVMRDSEPGEDGKNDENSKGTRGENCEKNRGREENDNREENDAQSCTGSPPKIQYFLESETSRVTDTSLTSQLPRFKSTLTLSCGTLAHDQEHTVLKTETSTVRRRSPEQIEQQNKQQTSVPETSEPEISLSSSSTNSSREVVPEQGLGTASSPSKPIVFIRSCRKSLKWSISRAHSKLYHSVPARLTLTSQKSRSLTNLMSEEDWHQDTEEVPKKESRTEF